MEPAGRSLRFKRQAGAFAAIVLFAALMGLAARLWQFGVVGPFSDPMDFRAFYCAGAALGQRENPYRVEPDRACQREVLVEAGLPTSDYPGLPAPFPPYALVAFAALALLPFRPAVDFWFATNVFAIGVAIVSITKLSGCRPAFVAAALVLPAGIVCLSLGQLVPIVLAAALFAALCARRGNGSGAAIGATIAALEPHLALPLWLGLALFVPAARKPLVVASAALGALTLLPGLPLNLEYAGSVVPEHARAELNNFEVQYSLSSLLAAFHAAPEVALRAGAACYAAMLVFGLTLGAALRRRFEDGAYAVLTPLAAVALGGPFLHIQQTVAAVPLGFMLVARFPRRSLRFSCATFALFLLAIPWPLIDMVRPQPVPVAARVPAAFSVPVTESRADRSSELAYTAFIDRFERRAGMHSPAELIARKAPTWFAIVALLSLACCLAYRPYGSRRPR